MQSIPCGDSLNPEIRAKIFAGETPEWVPQKYKKAYNSIEKAAIELSDIKCSDAEFVSAEIKRGVLVLVIKRNTIVTELEIGDVPGIEKVWIDDKKLKFVYKSGTDTFWDKFMYYIGGIVSGVAIAVAIGLIL